jgi:hypothetical protein
VKWRRILYGVWRVLAFLPARIFYVVASVSDRSERWLHDSVYHTRVWAHPEQYRDQPTIYMDERCSTEATEEWYCPAEVWERMKMDYDK